MVLEIWTLIQISVEILLQFQLYNLNKMNNFKCLHGTECVTWSISLEFLPSIWCWPLVRRLMNTLLSGTLYSLGTLCSPALFTQHILLPSTQFASKNTLLLGTLCFSAHFASWNTLLIRALCSMEHLKQSVPGSKVFQGVTCSKQQKIQGSKVLCD